MWKAQQINDDDINKVKLVAMLQDRELTWYIKYITTNLNSTLVETKTTLNVEFRKPKSQAQCVTKIKDMKKTTKESMWDIDQRLKCLLG